MQFCRDQINCLLDTTLSEKYPPDLAALTEELQGQLYSADQQCVHAYGRGSFVCRVRCIIVIESKHDKTN